MNFLFNANRVLTLTAHPDDEVLGFGASASLLTAKGIKVTNCFLSGDVNARVNKPSKTKFLDDINEAQQIMGCEEAILGPFENVKFNVVPHLELVQYIEKIIDKVQPTVIFTHWPGDLNNDHYHTALACMAAARLPQRRGERPISAVYMMEIPSSTDWSFPGQNQGFQPNTFFEIGEKALATKLEALNAYSGVMRPYPHPRSTEAVSGLAAQRGAQAGLKFAEAFHCVNQAFSLIE